MNSYYAVRRSATVACTACEPAEWESAITAVFQQLQSQGAVTSWSVAPYRNGVIVHVTVPGEPAADLIVLPRSGQPIGL